MSDFHNDPPPIHPDDPEPSLTLAEVPDFPGAFPSQGMFQRLTPAKWKGLRERCLHVDDIDQIMYMDLMMEVIHLAGLEVIHRAGREAPPQAEETAAAPTVQVVTEVPPSVLQVALMRHLAGVDINTDSAKDLMDLVEKVTASVNEGLNR